MDANGGLLATETFPVGRRHYAELLARLEGFGPIDKVGVEGTGSYGAGLARRLRGSLTTLIVRELAQRARNLREEIVRHNQLLRPLIRETAPELLAVYGVGIDTAARLLVARPATTPNAFTPKPPGPTCAASHPSPRRRACPEPRVVHLCRVRQQADRAIAILALTHLRASVGAGQISIGSYLLMTVGSERQSTLGTST